MHDLIVGIGLILAVPTIGEGERPLSPEERQAAGQYAMQLMNVIGQIRPDYIREVDEADLIRAAIRGLYETARRPEPKRLLTQLDRAESSAELTSVLSEARARLGNPDELRGPRDLIISLRALPRALDPYCELVQDSARSGTGQAFDFGFELAGASLSSGSTDRLLPPGFIPSDPPPQIEPIVPYPWRIGEVAPGGPAQQAGLRPGDRITHWNGDEITSTESLELFIRLREMVNIADVQRPPTIRLTVRRIGVANPFSVSLTMKPYQLESVFGVRRDNEGNWNYWLNERSGIGYIRLGSIDAASPDQMDAALGRLKAQGMKGLVFDLRWCPGGYLTPSVQICDIFLNDGVIATPKYRNPNKGSQVFRVGMFGIRTFRLTGVPVVVLTNAQTSGAGELIAAALQDNNRATIVGQRTLGKGSIQSIIDTGINGYSFKLTQGSLLRGSGKNLQRFPDSKLTDEWGVRPEPQHRLMLSDEASDQLKEWWDLQALRPGGSREALPLDDPRKDPQREFGVSVLRGLLEGES